MAVRPIVLVYQEFATQSVSVALPDLNVLIVGPAYRLNSYTSGAASVDVGSLTTAAAGTAATAATLSATAFPGWTAGDVFNDTSGANVPAVYLDTAYVEMAFGNDGVITGDTNTLTSAGTNFVTAGIQAGDRLVVTGFDQGSNTRTVAKTVQAVSSSVLTLTTNFATSGVDVTGTTFTGITLTLTGLKFRVERPLSGVKVNESVTVASSNGTPTAAVSNMTVNVGGVAKKVIYGKAQVSYRALRTDINRQPVEIRSLADIRAKIGAVDERNPLAVAALVAYENAFKMVTCLGIDSDDAAGHLTAIDAMRGRRDIYAIVPLTSDLQTIKHWRDDAEAQAAPGVARFRIIIASYSLPASKQIYAPAGTPGTLEAGSGTFTLLDNAATFKTTGVVAGDTVTVGSTAYPVVTVDSENRLTLTGTSLGESNKAYTISRTFTAQTAVTELASDANSLKSKRCTLVWPDECLVSGVVNGATGLQSHQPGYYVAAAVGGMVAGLPPQQGFTYIGMAGIQQVFRSNTYFVDEQIDALSDAGFYVVVQDTPSSLPYCIHELTTDPTTVESSELVVVKNFDYVSIAYRDALIGFLGRYNVLPETIAVVRAAFDTVSSTLKLKRQPLIGAPLVSAEIVSVGTRTDAADEIEINAYVTLPRPLNRIHLHLTA